MVYNSWDVYVRGLGATYFNDVEFLDAISLVYNGWDVSVGMLFFVPRIVLSRTL